MAPRNGTVITRLPTERPPACFALSGSGSQLIAQVGAMSAALRVLSIDSIGGTSGGAITAAAFASGMTPLEARGLCMSVFTDRATVQKLGVFAWNRRRWGLHSMRPILDVLRRTLPAKMGNFEHRWGAVVCPAALARGVVLRSDKEPGREAPDVVAASAAIPLFFEPVILRGLGRTFDGGAFGNVCADMWDDRLAPTIVIRVSEVEQEFDSPDDVPEYIGAVINTLLNAASSTHVSTKKWARTCTLDPPGSGMKFHLDAREINDRFDSGFETMARWLRVRPDLVEECRDLQVIE